MISHRIFTWRHAAIMIAALFSLTACERVTDATHPLSPVARSDDGNPGCVGNSCASGRIAARVLVNKAGRSLLEIRTGTYDNATGAGAFNGTLEKIQYKVYDSTGKQLLVRNANVTALTYWSDVIPYDLSPKNFSVVIQANLRGVGGDGKRTDVVRETAITYFNPDASLTLGDINARPIKVAGQYPLNPVSLPSLSSVKMGDSQWYQVTFSNTGPTGRSDIAVRASCEVRVNGNPVPDIEYAWTGSPQNPGLVSAMPATKNIGTPIVIRPNEAAICSFKMALNEPVGTLDAVTVIAHAIDPLDYDTSNNEVSDFVNIVDFTVTPPSGDATVTGMAGQITDELVDGTTVTVRHVAEQHADVQSELIVLDPGANGATFTLAFGGWTGKLNAGTLDLADQHPLVQEGSWTDNLHTIINLATVANPGAADYADLVPDASRCISAAQRRKQGANVTVTNWNGGNDRTFICVDKLLPGSAANPGTVTKYKLTAGFRWVSPESSDATLSSYTLFDQAIRFSLTLDVGTLGTVGLDSQLSLTDNGCVGASPLGSTYCRRTKGWQPPPR